ncbi:transcriptional regulator domain-containing protein [Bradyrhizobium diazoefficiens]
MPTQYWRSPETIERLNRLERPGFALEFLRRNADYRPRLRPH